MPKQTKAEPKPCQNEVNPRSQTIIELGDLKGLVSVLSRYQALLFWLDPAIIVVVEIELWPDQSAVVQGGSSAGHLCPRIGGLWRLIHTTTAAALHCGERLFYGVHCDAAGKDVVIIAQALDLAKENCGGFEYGSKLNFTFTGDVVHMFSKKTEENLL